MPGATSVRWAQRVLSALSWCVLDRGDVSSVGSVLRMQCVQAEEVLEEHRRDVGRIRPAEFIVKVSRSSSATLRAIM